MVNETTRSEALMPTSGIWYPELLACCFFIYLATLAAVGRSRPASRSGVIVTCLACVSINAALPLLQSTALFPLETLRIVREWFPCAIQMIGYTTCGHFYRQPSLSKERWLLRSDKLVFTAVSQCLGGFTDFTRTAPRLLLETLELAYLLSYVSIPGGYAVFCWLGYRQYSQNYWSSMLVAAFTSYGSLPWCQTRSPRHLERPGSNAMDKRSLLLRQVNLQVLSSSSVGANTLPSGHAATATSAALSVVHVMDVSGGWWWSVAFLVVAALIVWATIIGRYHYTVDSVLGVGSGIIGWVVGFRLLSLPCT